MEVIKITQDKYPKRLLKIKNPPEKLYIEGNCGLLNKNSLAIVGARKCTEYGIKYSAEFVKKIAENDITIISGFAIGIDAVAHEIASQYKGNTIAVMGAGFSHIYPEENKELLKQILENDGCIISEYPPEEEVNMKNFPKRNRIISGISNGILVIEAGYRSGSTITAKYGFEQNKKVFCLPRDIGISKGVGTNGLIKQGATLVTTPEDILKEFQIADFEKKEIYEENENIPQIENKYLDIYNLITYIPSNIEYLTSKSGLPISEINQKLTMLELEGHIKSLPGNYYVRM